MPEDGKPTFSELRDAMMPPGTDKDALWAALKGAHQTGGHVPGRQAPDISGTLNPAVAKMLGIPPGTPAAPPADPFPPGAAPAAALHEMFTDFLAAGFTEEQATAILGKMLAAYGREP